MPPGHPDLAKDKNKRDVFSTSAEIDEHREGHTEEEVNGAFEEYKDTNICRFYTSTGEKALPKDPNVDLSILQQN